MTDQRITSMKDVKVGDFIKFCDKDKKGKFSYTGEVIGIGKDPVFQAACIETICFEGNFGFVICAENELYLLDGKPVGWDKFKKDPAAYRRGLRNKEEAKEEARAVPVMKTQKEQVFDLVKDNPKLTDSKLWKLVRDSVKGDEAVLKNYIKLGQMKYKK